MKAQLLFHIKSLNVQAHSRVGCTRWLLNRDELLHMKKIKKTVSSNVSQGRRDTLLDHPPLFR